VPPFYLLSGDPLFCCLSLLSNLLPRKIARSLRRVNRLAVSFPFYRLPSLFGARPEVPGAARRACMILLRGISSFSFPRFNFVSIFSLSLYDLILRSLSIAGDGIVKRFRKFLLFLNFCSRELSTAFFHFFPPTFIDRSPRAWPVSGFL